MNVADIAAGMRSNNAHTVWTAAWAIIHTIDAATLRTLSAYIPEFRRALKTAPQGSGIRDGRLDMRLAIDVLDTSQNGRCRCTLYPQTDRLAPRQEEELGCVSIDAADIRHDLYEEQFQVTCRACGKRYWVREVLGYHYPWWEWRAA